MYQAGLVLEGGGMKGVYTAGVLDFFWTKRLHLLIVTVFPWEPARSAAIFPHSGAEELSVVVDYLKDPHYCGFYSMATTGDIFNAKMCYDTIPNELNPYDYEAAMKYPGNAYAVMTDVETGAPVYYKMQDMRKISSQCRHLLPCLLFRGLWRSTAENIWMVELRTVFRSCIL